MNICNGCGAEIPTARYGPTQTLCPGCIAHYHDNAPEDDLDRWQPAHESRAELRSQIAEYQGKRPDQVAFSVRVLTVAAFIAAAAFLGTCIAAILTALKP